MSDQLEQNVIHVYLMYKREYVNNIVKYLNIM